MAWKVLELVQFTKGTLEELLQMFEQPISGMVHLPDSNLTKSVWRYLVAKINYNSTDWFLNATNFHLKLFLNGLKFIMILCYTTKKKFHR